MYVQASAAGIIRAGVAVTSLRDGTFGLGHGPCVGLCQKKHTQPGRECSELLPSPQQCINHEIKTFLTLMNPGFLHSLPGHSRIIF